MPRKHAIVPREPIEQAIGTVRGLKVMTDADLAKVYGVTTKRLNQQVVRNADRFPDDFSFVLTQQEVAILRLQIATSSSGHGGRRYRVRVFTEHGAVMAASVLNTPIAVAASIEVVRAFVRLRQFVSSQAEFSRKLAALEAKLTDHDGKLAVVFDAIRRLMNPPVQERKGRIGFQ